MAETPNIFTVPWSRFCGPNKGRKRVVLDSEGDEQLDVINTTGPDPNIPVSIAIFPSNVSMAMTFDISVFKTSRLTGYGKWYGKKFGEVHELNEVWD